LQSHGVAVIEDWPKKSGDIMPLETVWFHLIDKLNEFNILAFDKAGLWSELSQLWQSLDVDGYFTQLISDMPERLKISFTKMELRLDSYVIKTKSVIPCEDWPK
jgi:hypothetical protein